MGYAKLYIMMEAPMKEKWLMENDTVTDGYSPNKTSKIIIMNISGMLNQTLIKVNLETMIQDFYHL